MRLAALIACLALACAAPRLPATPGAPGLVLDVRPDARVLDVDLRPAPEGWELSGRLSLPRPALPGEAVLALEGLDAEGRSLWRREAELELRGGAPRRRVDGRFALRLPADGELAGLRLRLPAGR